MNESFELERINFFVTSGRRKRGGGKTREKRLVSIRRDSLDKTNARICYDSFSFLSFFFSIKRKKIPVPNYLVRDYLLEIHRFFFLILSTVACYATIY